VNAALRYFVKYKCKKKLTIITNIYQNEKKHFRPALRWMIHMAPDCVLDPYSLVSYRSFTAMLVWSAFFNSTKMFVCYYRYLCIFSPPENDSFRKDLCFSPDVLFIFFPSIRSPRCVGQPAWNFAQWSVLGRIL